MKVFVTGGTGFVGSNVLGELVKAGHAPQALVRKNRSRGTDWLPAGVEIVSGDINDDSLADKMLGCDAAIHLVGIIKEIPSKGVTFEKVHHQGTLNVLSAMKDARISRLVHMSALGAERHQTGGYFRTKWAAEEAVLHSGLDFTVMKPSMIHGPRDEVVNMLSKQIRYLPVLPVIGDGSYELQPVSANDVARGFVRALDTDAAVGKTYRIGGPERFTYDRMLDAIASAMGKDRTPKVHLPLGLMKTMVNLMEGLPYFPITSDQLRMLLMGNVCDPSEFVNDLAIELTPFEEGVREYIRH